MPGSISLVSGGLPGLGNALEFLRSPETLVERGWREHGSVFAARLPGRNVVVLLGHDHAKFLFTETDRRLSIRDAYPFFRHMFGKDSYFLADHEEYKRQRDVVLPRFQSRQLSDYIVTMDASAREMIRDLGDSGEFELTDVLSRRVLQVAATCFLGEEFSRRLTGHAEVLQHFSRGIDPVLPSWFPAPHLIRSHRARDRLHGVIGQIMDERRQDPLDPPDFLQILTGAHYSDGAPVPRHVLVNLALMLTWTAWETTTGQLSWAVIDLIQHPDELARLLTEQKALTPNAPLDVKTVNRLDALDRALHETERLHPPTNGIVRLALEDIEYAGFRIRKGDFVTVVPSVSHRLPDVYPEPDRYRPDRFLEDPLGMARLIGFGGGMHRCLGKAFAYLEMKAFITRIFQAYHVELVGPKPVPVSGQRTKWPAAPCQVRYKRRSS